MSASVSLTARGLACQRGLRLLFEDLSFSVSGGGALAVTGPNGAGKSSLLRIAAGLLEPADGDIWFGEGEAAGDAALYLGHQDAVKPQLTVAENLTFWVRMFGGDPAGVNAALARFGLASIADLAGGVLSAGQRKRLALARFAFFIGGASARPLWILDEPDSALDVNGREALDVLMADHLAAGGLILAATHRPLAAATDELKLGELKAGAA